MIGMKRRTLRRRARYLALDFGSKSTQVPGVVGGEVTVSSKSPQREVLVDRVARSSTNNRECPRSRR